MTHDPPDYPHGSPQARSVFAYILRRGGSIRTAPLLRRMGMEGPALVEAVNELADRGWIKIVWREAVRDGLVEESRPYTDAERLVSTRWGRNRYRSTWPAS